MFKKSSIFILVGFAVSLVSFRPAYGGHVQVPGEEEDRGSVKTPDYAATPHPGKAVRLGYPKVPNRSLADDTNHDGVISRSEWKGSMEDFNRLDLNRDNVLSQRELDAYIQVGVDRFADLDVNHDGIVSQSEWHGMSYLFRKLDRNHDGVLTRSEFYEGSQAATKGGI